MRTVIRLASVASVAGALLILRAMVAAAQTAAHPAHITPDTHVSLSLLIGVGGVLLGLGMFGAAWLRDRQRFCDHLADPDKHLGIRDLQSVGTLRVVCDERHATIGQRLNGIDEKLDELLRKR